MSWDISIQKFSHTYRSLDEIPQTERGTDLGPREAVHRAVQSAFPGTDWTDPAWGCWDSAFGSIEFNVGTDPADSIMLHVRAGSEVVSGIVALCKDNGWQGIDCGSGELIDQSDHPEEGLAAWTAYRNQIVGEGG